MDNQTHCEKCGASLKKFWHRLSPGLIGSLIKFRRVVQEKNSNNLHLYNDLKGPNQLTTAEQMNWTKLRFNGLVAKAEQEKHWLITRRGGQFLNGAIAIPKRVQTFRNRVIAKDEETVYIKDIIHDLPVFDSREDMKFDYAGETDMETVRIANKKKNKIKNPCPKCGTSMKLNLTTEFQGNVAKVVKKNLKCPKCGEEDFIL
jgi:hypothetical protein